MYKLDAIPNPQLPGKVLLALHAHHARAMLHACPAGVSGMQQLKYYNQMQALARPANASDPKLKLWIKSAAPVIAQPPANALSSQFRDPTTAWRQVSSWIATTQEIPVLL